MRRLFLAVAACVGLLVSMIINVTPALAAQGGLTVTPAVVQLSPGKGQDSISFTVSVTNDSANKVSVISRVDDFTALNSTGSALFLNNISRAASPHGLAHWMASGAPAFDLEAHATRTVAVAIDGLSAMAPGGHYGAVIFGAVPTGGVSQTNTIGANAAVSTLVFLTTDTPGKKAVSLLPPDLGSFQLAMPSSVDLVFANTGDVQATPRGLVTLTDPLRHEVARSVVNVDSGQVLPGTRRLYQITFPSITQPHLPGLYRLSVAYRADGQAQGVTYEQTFLYVPSALLVVAGVLVVAGLLFALRHFMPGNLYRLER